MTSSPSGTQPEKRSHSSFNKLTNTIKLSSLTLAEVSETQTNFLDTTVYKGERFKTESVQNVRTNFKPAETFQYTHFSTCRPSGVKRGFIEGGALRLLRTNSSKTLFEESITNFKTHLLERGYPENFIQTTLSEFTFEDRTQALQQKQNKTILPFVMQYHPAVPNLKPILVNSWHFITQQPLLNNIFNEPPLISYKRGHSLKEILVKAKL